MSSKRRSGLIGIVVGGAGLLYGIQFFKEQGFVAIGMPLFMLVLGVAYFINGKSEE